MFQCMSTTTPFLDPIKTWQKVASIVNTEYAPNLVKDLQFCCLVCGLPSPWKFLWSPKKALVGVVLLRSLYQDMQGAVADTARLWVPWKLLSDGVCVWIIYAITLSAISLWFSTSFIFLSWKEVACNPTSSDLIFRTTCTSFFLQYSNSVKGLFTLHNL